MDRPDVWIGFCPVVSLLQSEFLYSNKSFIHTSKNKKSLIFCLHNANCSVVENDSYTFKSSKGKKWLVKQNS
jgi:hypothetical protein